MKFEKYLVLLLFLIMAVLVVSCSSSDNTGDAINNAQAEEIPTGSVDAETDLQDGTYVLDTQLSTLTYAAARIVGSSHIGTVGVKSGELIRSKGAFTGGNFVVDMNTITETKNSERFLTHIRGTDFFNIAEHPVSTLVIKTIEDDGNGMYAITGDLTIKDQTHSISFPAELHPKDYGMHIISEFTIDRTKWGITYDSGTIFQQIGDRAIKDDIQYKLDLTFKKV